MQFGAKNIGVLPNNEKYLRTLIRNCLKCLILNENAMVVSQIPTRKEFDTRWGKVPWEQVFSECQKPTKQNLLFPE